MKREDNGSGFVLDLIPNRNEVASYISSNGRAVTLSRWRVDLNGTPRSAWNHSCWRVFYFSFLEVYQYTSAYEKEIENAFFHHLRYLQSQWKSLLGQGQEAPADEHKAHNKAERKRTVG